MNTERLALLEQYLRDEPGEPFNYYALALEYRETDTEKARFYFEKLIQLFPAYLPAYYHAAQFYAEMQQPGPAKKLFIEGISLAEKLNEQKTLKELKQAFDTFLFEWEE